MSLLNKKDWQVAEAIAEIGYKNPFLPERIELEKKALGREFASFQPFMQYRANCSVADMFPNAASLRIRSDQLLQKMRVKLLENEPASKKELEVYENLAMYQLYARYMATIHDLPVARFRNRPEDDILESYDAFATDYEYFLELPGTTFPANLDRDVIFAGLFQVERAFFHIFRHIIGASMSAARLRAAIWQSIFTHDMRRYLRTLYQYMGDIPTLITGPSGTGKELVAQSIAYSRFVEFDSKRRRFVVDYTDCFTGLNLTAIASTLIESELFGHAKGAFTDAKSERQGYLDEAKCSRWGTVFLDEIGELDTLVQVKLLRVLQSREFQRVGESKPRHFVGKIIAATNQDLGAEMEAGRFRGDFYYRICADRIETPSLRAQLRESPGDIENFVRFIASGLLQDLPEEVSLLTDEVVRWVKKNLGDDYAWPGNIRELEQCVRSIMIRGEYVPTRRRIPQEPSPLSAFAKKVEEGNLTREELLTGYFSLVYAKAGSYRSAGKQLGVNWRTVKAVADAELARKFAE